MVDRINYFRGKHFFLSNFYIYGADYKTSEHRFQSAKATCLADSIRVWDQITPGKAKSVGDSIKLRPDWEEVKDEIMFNILKRKFSYGRLGYKLKQTGDAYLEEGNTWHDNYWGNCYCWKCSGIMGLNKLGEILMKIRRDYEQKDK